MDLYTFRFYRKQPPDYPGQLIEVSYDFWTDDPAILQNWITWAKGLGLTYNPGGAFSFGGVSKTQLASILWNMGMLGRSIPSSFG